ncbi:methyltransferase domain-containing protein [Mucilaginibacter sp. cycad4]|uniref:class I SAM-dependent methyltransferase n=1 Tax=Mucilaginibacter sp. cycad4 TaxID=3342096 RepID=UPI002AAAC285|nr:methyltransferase domain-containing protein [Mucilaginibacter gossypii]WPV02488.1 methyltransferase domain-containing protein [Mucilaginibacter gossypii]
MIQTVKNYIRQCFFPPNILEKNSVDAYDIWAENYDEQPGNLMLDLDEVLFPRLVNSTSIAGKNVADIGCGTGRHWEKMFALNPGRLTGFDTSGGMLARLQQKFPSANIYRITDDLFSDMPSGSFDTIVSTLTVAHIKNIEVALQAWMRILKPTGDIIITDFHPQTLANGGKRTFKHGSSFIAVENYVHPVNTIKNVLLNNNFKLVAEEEIKIDETMKHYYANKNAIHVYDKYKGFPIIYGLHLRRNDGTE